MKKEDQDNVNGSRSGKNKRTSAGGNGSGNGQVFVKCNLGESERLAAKAIAGGDASDLISGLHDLVGTGDFKFSLSFNPEHGAWAATATIAGRPFGTPRSVLTQRAASITGAIAALLVAHFDILNGDYEFGFTPDDIMDF